MTQHPYIVIWSVKLKQKKIIIELTIPFQENFDWAPQRKSEKYENR